MSESETSKAVGAPLRLWPGVAAGVLLLFCRFGVKALVPGFQGYLWGLMGSLVCAVLLLLWWLAFSRARWFDRVGAIAVVSAALGASWLLRHESMSAGWLLTYALPWAFTALAAGAVAGRRLVAAAILLTPLAWAVIRTDGIDGDHRATFAWRWSATTEQRLLASPLRAPAAPAVERTPAAPAKTEPAPSIAAEWPGFRGPNRDSVIHGITIDTDWARHPPIEVWRKPVGPGWSSFAVQGGLIYTQQQRGAEELVTAYKAATGELAWSHADPARFFESSAGAGPRATPTLANGRVYSLGATGIVNVLDAATGQRLWSRNATADTKSPVPMWGFAASPLVTQGLVIVHAGHLAAYDAETGALKWVGKSSGESYSSPHLATLGGVRQVIIPTAQGIEGLDAATGAKLWGHEWKGMPIIQPAIVPGGVLASATQADGTVRIEPVKGASGWAVNTRWTSLALKPYFNDTVIHKDHAYGFDSRILACIDLAEGKRAWKGGRYGNGQMLLLADQDLLLVLSEDGELALVQASPAGFNEVAKVNALNGKTWNHPVIAAGLLFVRNAQEMAAYRLAAAK